MATFFCDEEIEKLEDGRSLAILRMRGYIQFEAVNEMEKQIVGSYNKGVYCLALDFSAVHTITSSGFGTLMKLYDQFQSANRHLVFLSVPKKIYTLFETLGIAGYFLKFDSKKQLIYFFTKGVLPSEQEVSAEKEQQKLQEAEENKKIARKPFNKRETLFDINIVQDIQNESLLEKEKKSSLPTLKESKGVAILEKSLEEIPKKEVTPLLAPNAKNNRPLSPDTKRIGSANYFCKIAIKNYQCMESGKTYPVKLILSLQQEKNANELATDESFEVQAVPIFPGCIVAPSFRKLTVHNKQTSTFFEITPVVTGKQIAKLEFMGPSSILQTIKIPFQVFTKWWGKSAIIGALGILLVGFLSESYQLAPCPLHWNLTYFLHQCKGLFYPCLVICILLILAYLFLKRTWKEKQDSYATELTFRS